MALAYLRPFCWKLRPSFMNEITHNYRIKLKKGIRNTIICYLQQQDGKGGRKGHLGIILTSNFLVSTLLRCTFSCSHSFMEIMAVHQVAVTKNKQERKFVIPSSIQAIKFVRYLLEPDIIRALHPFTILHCCASPWFPPFFSP